MNNNPKILFASLGCDKNLADSEHMLSILDREGYALTDQNEEADVIIINTCCFIGDAMEESINTILELSEYKDPSRGRAKGIIVCGCLAERHASDIRREIPEVDVIVGTRSWSEIAQAVRDVLEGSRSEYLNPSQEDIDSSGRLLSQSIGYSYLKIAEGCNKHCTYCVIPDIRGPYRSIPLESLVKEAEMLAENGISEIILVAQEICEYGKDLYGRKSLVTLLRKLSDIHGIRWIRLMYAYPEEIDEDLIEEIRTNEKIVKYIDMPIQHCDDSILRRMNRKTSQEELKSLIKHIRDRIPEICIRTTLITGFPGETESAHKNLISFIRECRFDRLGAFRYSREENTPAADFPDQIDEEEKQRRYDEIMTVQQEISSEKNTERIGETLLCMIEGRITGEGGISRVYAARSYRDAPEVDGFVFIESEEELMSGSFIYATVTAAHEYDLTAEPQKSNRQEVF